MFVQLKNSGNREKVLDYSRTVHFLSPFLHLLWHDNPEAAIFTGGADLQFPLSRDEHAAMARYLSGIRRQLQDVSDLFSARYGKNSSIAESGVKTLVSTTLLEHELLLLEGESQSTVEPEREEAQSAAY